MPFVTEHVWKEADFDGDLIRAEWPEHHVDPAARGAMASGERFEALRTFISDMRRLRSEQGIEPAKAVEFAFVASQEIERLIAENMDVVKALARASNVCAASAIEGDGRRSYPARRRSG